VSRCAFTQLLYSTALLALASVLMAVTLLAPVVGVAFGVAYHMTRSRDDADDLVQEAAFNAWRAFDQFQPGTNFKAWFMRILTHCFFAQYRKKKRRPQTLSLEDASPTYIQAQLRGAGIAPPESDPATLVMDRLDEDQVADAIGALPEEFRLVCALYFMQEASYQEIADMIECPVGTVRSRLHRGRRMLQKALWHIAQERGIVASLASEGV
jgi:RNA polymerase sigma-70 factor (ECF subfamily)